MILLLAGACRTSMNESLVMRAPDNVYHLGHPDPGWSGRAVVTGNRLDIDYPVIAANNVGCAKVDSIEVEPTRRYYWLATAGYPGSRYPDNHFIQVALDFTLSPAALPTRAKLDSAFKAGGVVVREAAGEPPFIGRTVRPERATVILSPELLPDSAGGERAWRLRVSIEGAEAIGAMLEAKADSLSLGWCQRDQWLTTTITVPLERRTRNKP